MLEKVNALIEKLEDEMSLMAVEPGERERLQDMYEELIDVRETLLATEA